MAGYRDYELDADDDHPYFDEYYDSNDEDSYDEGDEWTDDDECDPMLQAPYRSPVRWRQIRIGDTVLEVSSMGAVKPFDAEFRLGYPMTSEGVQLAGTPFRTYTVEFATYYMHDIVYQAFYGKPPEGYEVRHVPAHTARPRSVYSNRLSCLMIAPVAVVPLVLGPKC
jgi:hypothetical protein